MICEFLDMDYSTDSEVRELMGDALSVPEIFTLAAEEGGTCCLGGGGNEGRSEEAFKHSSFVDAVDEPIPAYYHEEERMMLLLREETQEQKLSEEDPMTPEDLATTNEARKDLSGASDYESQKTGKKDDDGFVVSDYSIPGDETRAGAADYRPEEALAPTDGQNAGKIGGTGHFSSMALNTMDVTQHGNEGDTWNGGVNDEKSQSQKKPKISKDIPLNSRVQDFRAPSLLENQQSEENGSSPAMPNRRSSQCATYSVKNQHRNEGNNNAMCGTPSILSFQASQLCSTSRRSFPCTKRQSFPKKLHKFLCECNCPSVISWSGDGRSFTIHDAKNFEETILSQKVICKGKIESFTHQLNKYSFHYITYRDPQGKKVIICFHENFQRDEPSLCSTIVLKNGH